MMYNIFYQSITWTNRNCSLHLLFAVEMNFRLKKQSAKLFSIENFDIDFFHHRFILSRNFSCAWTQTIAIFLRLYRFNGCCLKIGTFSTTSLKNLRYQVRLIFFQINSARALILVRSCRFFINPNPIVLIFILKHAYAKRR